MSTKNIQLAQRLETLAGQMQQDIDHRRRQMTQNATPKRLKEYNSRLHDADNAERTQRALCALAAAHRAGAVPEALADLKTKTEIAPLVHKGLLGGRGYYDVIPSGEYSHKTPKARAMQSLIDGNRTAEEIEAEKQRHAAEKLKIMVDEVRFHKIPGFFPTPAAVIDTMIEQAAIENGMTVLEPSAGIGSILDAVLAKYPACKISYCELRSTLRSILTAKYKDRFPDVHEKCADFMEMPASQFDRILMNPPFEKQQDLAHIRRAFEMLAPGGRLVAIVSAGCFSNSNAKAKDFRSWLAEIGCDVQELNGAFSKPDAFRRTAVAAKLLTITKKVEAPHRSRVNGKKQSDTLPIQQKSNQMNHESVSEARETVGASAPLAAAAASNVSPSDLMSLPPASTAENILSKYRPATLEKIIGQPAAVKALRAFTRAPYSAAFIFAGPSGIGKTAAALALANDLGCDPEWGGITEIPSGTQDGKAVEMVLRNLRLRPLGGSGWKVAIVNEADRMTEQAEAMWLDGLEHLPPKSVVIFTTNNLSKLSHRLIRRCEVHHFEARSEAFQNEMNRYVATIWEHETGRKLETIPTGLGKFELSDSNYSIGLALQQIAPYIRTGDPLPEHFIVPIVRTAKTPAAAPVSAPFPLSQPTPLAPQAASNATKTDHLIPTPTRQYCPVCRSWLKKGEMAMRAAERWLHVNCSNGLHDN